ncbi:MAG: replication protein [bacterium]|nr:replication protein [bacterium]
MARDSGKFPGFPPEMRRNFWMYPRVMDAWWHQLSGSEQKTLDFCLRKLWGWEKQSDRISLSQFEKGTGLSQRQIITASAALEQKGYVSVKRQIGKTNEYSLVVQEVHQSSEKTATGGGAQNAQPTSEKITHTIDKVPIDKAIEKIYSIYKTLVLPTARLKTGDREKIQERLTEFHPREVVRAIKNFGESDWWMNNSNIPKTIGWFFASDERIDKFLSLDPLPSDDSAYLDGQAKP